MEWKRHQAPYCPTLISLVALTTAGAGTRVLQCICLAVDACQSRATDVLPADVACQWLSSPSHHCIEDLLLTPMLLAQWPPMAVFFVLVKASTLAETVGIPQQAMLHLVHLGLVNMMLLVLHTSHNSPVPRHSALQPKVWLHQACCSLMSLCT